MRLQACVGLFGRSCGFRVAGLFREEASRMRSTKNGVCPVCRGKKTVTKGGKTTTCFQCDGSGEAGRTKTK